MLGFIVAIAISIVSAVLIYLTVSLATFQSKTNKRLLKIKKDLEYLDSRITSYSTQRQYSNTFKPKYLEGSLELRKGENTAKCDAVFTPVKYG
jgi:hypothetical protein